VTATRTILGVAGVGLTVRGSDRAGVHQIHHTYGDLLGSLKRERDEAMTVTQETVRLMPDLFAAASK